MTLFFACMYYGALRSFLRTLLFQLASDLCHRGHDDRLSLLVIARLDADHDPGPAGPDGRKDGDVVPVLLHYDGSFTVGAFSRPSNGDFPRRVGDRFFRFGDAAEEDRPIPADDVRDGDSPVVFVRLRIDFREHRLRSLRRDVLDEAGLPFLFLHWYLRPQKKPDTVASVRLKHLPSLVPIAASLAAHDIAGGNLRRLLSFPGSESGSSSPMAAAVGATRVV